MGIVGLSFITCLLVFVVIGALSIRRKQSSVDDYLTASHQVAPWLVGLSSVATNNSGYMFIGLIGYTYYQGVAATWIALGWIVGDLVAWYSVHPWLRRFSERNPVNTVPAVIAQNPAQAGGPLRRVGAVLALMFLAVYAAAQLTAGSKALHVMFGWPLWLGAVIGALVVLLYSFAGGIRASIWTDAAQAVVMLGGMILLLTVGLSQAGSPWTLWRLLEATDPALVRWTPGEAELGLALFIAGWIAAGLGVAGQPHILVRTLALRDPGDIPRARLVYFGWYVPFAVLTVLVGLYARVLLGGDNFDPELALPLMAEAYLPGVLVGAILAAVFAATLSTADSMLLSCSAAISQDLLPGFGQSYARTKLATALVTMVVLGIALASPASVFQLVIFAWSGLGATLGPVLALRVARQPLDRPTAAIMMLTALAVVIGWRSLGLNDAVYEILPAFLCVVLVYLVRRPRIIRQLEEVHEHPV
ncbi:MAG TPA: sodium/proline symporter [Arenicellales bacterium]|nr:sodium/proline symporter [Arenicellales bacterium]